MNSGIITERDPKNYVVRVAGEIYGAGVYAIVGGRFGVSIHHDRDQDNQRRANRAARYVFARIMPGATFRVVRVYRRTDLPGAMRFEVRDVIPAGNERVTHVRRTFARMAPEHGNGARAHAVNVHVASNGDVSAYCPCVECDHASRVVANALTHDDTSIRRAIRTARLDHSFAYTSRVVTDREI